MGKYSMTPETVKKVRHASETLFKAGGVPLDQDSLNGYLLGACFNYAVRGGFSLGEMIETLKAMHGIALVEAGIAEA
jgi:hypothetical protein